MPPPGMPETAAELAYRDAAVSHVKNGIYGEMFIAALISAAFITNELDELIQVGTGADPARTAASRRWSPGGGLEPRERGLGNHLGPDRPDLRDSISGRTP